MVSRHSMGPRDPYRTGHDR